MISGHNAGLYMSLFMLSVMLVLGHRRRTRHERRAYISRGRCVSRPRAPFFLWTNRTFKFLRTVALGAAVLASSVTAQTKGFGFNNLTQPRTSKTTVLSCKAGTSLTTAKPMWVSWQTTRITLWSGAISSEEHTAELQS